MTAATPTTLDYAQQGHVVTLTLNQPERRNPLTGNHMVDEFLAAFDRVSRDGSVRALIITGAGSAFSAGGDIQEMQRQSQGTVDAMAVRGDYRHGIQRLPKALLELEVPTIAAVNGPAIGAGLDLACMCDMRIASSKAKFAESFVKLGIIPGDGGAWLLPRLIGWSRAAELSFTGRMIDAQQALDWQLVGRVVEPEALLPAAMALAEEIAANPPHAVRLAKRLMREAQHARIDTVLEMAAVFQAISHQTSDHREAVAAFLEKRAPKFGG